MAQDVLPVVAEEEEIDDTTKKEKPPPYEKVEVVGEGPPIYGMLKSI